ncbi:hypothetical protein GH714_019661 [Hevea brasiliensis]|uniref:Uncharacterized protein n=1 Tax=Hevea brasiliensis TaxID=3981 RepID=A0A6A6M7F5_HEVBR|nr:hypothetical protein GH714_019661 [Hevea brasiliensis]
MFKSKNLRILGIIAVKGIAESKGDTKGFNVKEETNLPDDATSPHGDGEEEEADIVEILVAESKIHGAEISWSYGGKLDKTENSEAKEDTVSLDGKLIFLEGEDRKLTQEEEQKFQIPEGFKENEKNSQYMEEHLNQKQKALQHVFS